MRDVLIVIESSSTSNCTPAVLFVEQISIVNILIGIVLIRVTEGKVDKGNIRIPHIHFCRFQCKQFLSQNICRDLLSG